MIDIFKRVKDAANAIYDAGYWTCDRPVDDKKLWEELRDSLGRESGRSPKPLFTNPRTHFCTAPYLCDGNPCTDPMQ